MFGMSENFGQTKNIFGWPRKLHLSFNKMAFLFYFRKQFFEFELLLSHALSYSSFFAAAEDCMTLLSLPLHCSLCL